MTNGGKDIRLGDDKRPVSVIPKDERYLYNILNGELLTDEYGNPLIAEVDTYFIKDATAERATSVSFTDESSPYVGIDHSYIGPASGNVAIYGNCDVHVGSATSLQVEVLQVSGATIGVGTTAGTVPTTGNITPITWYNYDLYGGPPSAGWTSGIGSDLSLIHI